MRVQNALPSDDTPVKRVNFALPAFLSGRIGMLRDYATAISGSAGRLVFSLLYFVLLANTLSIADYGLFATAAAAGLMLSRIVAFGYISALYRIATIRPALIGAFTTGFLLMLVLSLPVLGAATAATYALLFSGQMAIGVFVTIIVAECLLWRPVEVVVIVNNGMGRFGKAAVLVILGTLLRAAAAASFVFAPQQDLATWSVFYLAANAVSLLVALLWFFPRTRLRFRPRLYWRRLPDSLYVAGAEILFYLQMEMDKLLVLALGGPHLAGIYAIIMRLVDLTAIPVRTFTMMLVQRMMRAPDLIATPLRRVMIETGIFAISALGLLGLAGLLYLYPRLLGANVAEAAPLVILALLIPGLRNLVEYQAELLFARGQTLVRAFNLALIAGLKGVLLTLLLVEEPSVETLVLALNGVFAALYVGSALLTYSAMRLPAHRF